MQKKSLVRKRIRIPKMKTQYNYIYTFNISYGEVMLQQVKNAKAKEGIKATKTDSLIDRIIIYFDDGSQWICCHPYMYLAMSKHPWHRCLFDRGSISNTSENAMKYIIDNHEEGSEIEYFN